MVNVVDLLAPFGVVLIAIAVAALLYFLVTTIKGRRSNRNKGAGGGRHAR